MSNPTPDQRRIQHTQWGMTEPRTEAVTGDVPEMTTTTATPPADPDTLSYEPEVRPPDEELARRLAIQADEEAAAKAAIEAQRRAAARGKGDDDDKRRVTLLLPADLVERIDGPLMTRLRADNRGEVIRRAIRLLDDGTDEARRAEIRIERDAIDGGGREVVGWMP